MASLQNSTIEINVNRADEALTALELAVRALETLQAAKPMVYSTEFAQAFSSALHLVKTASDNAVMSLTVAYIKEAQPAPISPDFVIRSGYSYLSNAVTLEMVAGPDARACAHRLTLEHAKEIASRMIARDLEARIEYWSTQKEQINL